MVYKYTVHWERLFWKRKLLWVLTQSELHSILSQFLNLNILVGTPWHTSNSSVPHTKIKAALNINFLNNS